jgi:superfamily II DNA or RNA helicase
MFLAIKQLPQYEVSGHVITFPDEYADRLGIAPKADKTIPMLFHPKSFDYQSGITKIALTKRKFAIFADCGLGKTLMFLDYAKNVLSVLQPNEKVLIISPLMVIDQTMAECERFYGDELQMTKIPSGDLSTWITDGIGGIGITNYEALKTEVPQGTLGCLILDESSLLKSHYGKYGTECIRLGRGLDWKLACTGTPAPNDRIEYANHAVFLDAFPTVNSFLARFFVNRGQTQERWVLKQHAIKTFYRELSHWAIFLNNPATYGWTDNTEDLPPIHVHVHDIDMTPEQIALTHEQTGSLFAHKAGGITNRAAMSSIGKGHHKGKRIPTNKTAFIRELTEQWPDESTIIWCIYNAEQDIISEAIPEAHSMYGATPHEERVRMIDDFKSGKTRILISKPKILGFGLNLQIATRQIFSGLVDSYESYYQAVKRSNRFGSKHPLNVHIPVTDIEMPMIETVLQKAGRVQRDTEEQESLFRDTITNTNI